MAKCIVGMFRFLEAVLGAVFFYFLLINKIPYVKDWNSAIQAILAFGLSHMIVSTIYAIKNPVFRLISCYVRSVFANGISVIATSALVKYLIPHFFSNNIYLWGLRIILFILFEKAFLKAFLLECEQCEIEMKA